MSKTFSRNFVLSPFPFLSGMISSGIKYVHVTMINATADKNNFLLLMLFLLSDGACLQGLWTRSEICPFYAWWQRHTVLGWMVWHSGNRKLCWSLSSIGQLAYWRDCLEDSSEYFWVLELGKIFTLCPSKHFSFIL